MNLDVGGLTYAMNDSECEHRDLSTTATILVGSGLLAVRFCCPTFLFLGLRQSAYATARLADKELGVRN